MRPYLAVVIDSFREAFASRVLPLLLVLFTLTLLLIAPLGLEEQSRGELQTEDILDARALIERFRSDGERDVPSPGRHVWRQMSPDLQQELVAEAARWPARQTALVKLQIELNRQLKEPAFYDPQAFQNVELTGEARELIAANARGERPTVRRNRLLLAAAFPGDVAPPRDELVRLTYLGFDPLAWLMGDTTFPRSEVETILQRVLAGFCSYFLGKFGVSVAILVSANIIPRMFEPGSIDLLFSKPVSRSLLFLTKFFSGCAFIFVNVSYFLVGLWIILGLRFGQWSTQLLLAIPVFLFVFAIVYSLSAVAGVLWRNPIVSVIVALSLWGACMMVGSTKGLMEHHQNSSRAVVIAPAGDALLSSDKSGRTFAWSDDPAGGRWVEVFGGAAESTTGGGLFRPLLGPVYDPQTRRIYAVELTKQGQGMQAAVGSVVAGAPENDWPRRHADPAPPRTSSLFVDRGDLLAVGPAGAYRRGAESVFGPQSGPFRKVAPQEASGWFTPFAAGWNGAARELAVYERGNVRLYGTEPDGALALRAERDLEVKQPALIAAGGRTVLVALADGTIQALDRETLRSRETFQPFGEREPRDIAASPDGRWFAVLFHHQRAWVFDAASGQPANVSLRGQGDISAVAFDAEGKLLVADRITRIRRYGLDPFALEKEFAPPPSVEDRIYRYGARPLYTILPKPGDLDYLVTYLFTDKLTEAIPGNEENLQTERNAPDVWGPVWSNIAFLAAILGLTCVYIARRDF